MRVLVTMVRSSVFRPAQILRDFIGFLRRPAVLAPSGLRGGGTVPEALVMIALQLAIVLGVMLPLLSLWQKAFHLPAPDKFDMIPQQWLVLATVVVAPLIEECVFRGWQIGRPRTLGIVLGLVLAGAGLALTRDAQPVAVRLALVGGALLAGGGVWFALRRRATPRWYCRAYPAVFYVVALLFAALHLSNYPSWSLLALPLVLPQLWTALVLGFVRMRIGLAASILTHMASNGAAMALVLLTR